MPDRRSASLPPPPRWAFLAAVAAGIAVRLWQYLGNPSLWIDELALAEDVLHIRLRDLVARPLPLDQIAPPGFLAALEASSVWLGTDERALRAFPFACAAASVPLFAVLARRVLRPWTALLAAAVFSLLPLLISWSASVKQYSTDVLAALAVMLAALVLLESDARPRRIAAAAAAGVLAPWLSHPAVFAVAGCGAAVVAARLAESPGRVPRPVAAAIVSWAASAAAAAARARSLLTESTRGYMARFWEPALPGAETLALAAVGAFLLARRAGWAAAVPIGPVAVTLAAAAAHAYPFSGRAILFLVPVFVLAAAEAAALAAEGIARLGAPRPAAAALIVVPLLAAFARDLPVYRREEMRPVARRLAARLRPDDAIYVYYGAARGFRFYAPRAGIDPSRAVVGGCHRGDTRAYLRELDALRGRPRAWVVIAHPTTRLREVPAIRGYLNAIGSRREEIRETGASAELFDLAEPARLAAASAESFPVPDVASPEEVGYGCAHGPIGTAPWE